MLAAARLAVRVHIAILTMASICSTVSDEQPVCWYGPSPAMTSTGLYHPSEQPRKELEDAIDSILVFRMPLPSFDSLLPESIIRLPESAQVLGDNLLLTPNSIDTLHDRPDIDGLALALIILGDRCLEETERTAIGLGVVCWRIAFAVDEG